MRSLFLWGGFNLKSFFQVQNNPWSSGPGFLLFDFFLAILDIGIADG